ncbi:antA/AntB antirepressor family protein, partial [Patescibacteria group bacterium]|nr:antA/AntB antirepressor family protein [Patescibacteria group bacterium]
QFADWIKDRIEKYDFIENIDYFAVHKIVKGVKIRADGMLIDEKTGQIIPKDYVLTIDMAKEIAMLENNEIGKKVRKYFIRTEENFKKVMRIALNDPKFINQLSQDFKETREETKDYRKDFTDSIKQFVSVKHYGTYTDILYQFLFAERAKEYRRLLKLAKKDFTRNTMYEEVLFVIGSFETGLAGELEKECNKKGKSLSQQEFINIFNQFSSTQNWAAYQKRVRKIMATYDEELRNIKHPKLIDYKKEFTGEDIKRLLGNKNSEKFN